jgi:hypothetical protein
MGAGAGMSEERSEDSLGQCDMGYSGGAER